MKTIIRIIVIILLSVSVCFATAEHFSKWKYDVKFINKGCISPVGEFTYKMGKPMGVLINGRYLSVPAGFVTDLATIPRIFWSFDSPFDGKYMSSAILHDYLYSCSLTHDRREADRILYTAMIEEGSSKWTANKFYFAVRVGGGGHYDPAKICY